MDGDSSVPSSTATSTARSSSTSNNQRTRTEASPFSRIRKGFLSFTASLQEGFRYSKASFMGLVKQLKAKNEKEASEADLQTAKMQVEATNDAENAKKRLDLM